MDKKIKTIFMGTPLLASAGLQALLNSDFFDIKVVITQKDKSAGRNLKINKSAVKILIEKYNLENDNKIIIWQPEKLKEIKDEVIKLNPELIIVIAYGKILPKEILEIPKYGCINVHGSLLPKYRGSSCIQGPILNGDKTSGITIMKMDEGMDTGPIIKKIEINLDEQENSNSLMEKIIKITSDNLVNTIIDYIEGKTTKTHQENKDATYVKMIKKEDGYLNFSDDLAEIIERKIRAYYPWPGAYCFIEKNDLPKTKILFKIIKVNKNLINNNIHQTGELFLYKEKLAMKCKDKAIIIEELQIEGKKAMNTRDFLQGNNWIIGKILK